MGMDFGWRPGYEQKMMKLLIKEKKKGIFFFYCREGWGRCEQG